MENFLIITCGLLFAVAVTLAIKLVIIRKACSEIVKGLSDKLLTDTNTLVDISCRDKYLRKLAAELNLQLRLLRTERQRFQQGDSELKLAVTNISHDLRTPLTAIRGYLELLEDEEKSEQTEKYLALISNRTQAMCTLTEELFRYSVISSLTDEKRENISLRDALEESLAAAYASLKMKGITPVISVTEEKIERYLDRSAVSRIFGNILSNAVKYSDGDLTVIMDEQGSVFFKNSAKELTPVLAGRLFDRFFTVETGRNSTGLGLSIAKLLTERMGGTIDAEFADGCLTIKVSFSEQ